MTAMGLPESLGHVEQTWSGETYLANSGHHREFDEWFLGRLTPSPSDRVLDVGCGTGDFTVRLADLVPEGLVVGVDRSPSMLQVARASHHRSNLSFVHGQAQDLDTLFECEYFDLVVSRAMFHWIAIDEWLPCYRAIANVLQPGGWFHSESGAAGNARRLVALANSVARECGLTPPALSHVDPGVALELLEVAGYATASPGVAMSVAQRRAMTRDDVVGVMCSQLLRIGDGRTVTFDREQVENLVRSRVEEVRRADGSYDQTFVRLHVLAQRSAG